MINTTRVGEPAGEATLFVNIKVEVIGPLEEKKALLHCCGPPRFCSTGGPCWNLSADSTPTTHTKHKHTLVYILPEFFFNEIRTLISNTGLSRFHMYMIWGCLFSGRESGVCVVYRHNDSTSNSYVCAILLLQSPQQRKKETQAKSHAAHSKSDDRA